MIETYTVRYRQPGQWLWRRVRNVRGDGVEPGQFRWLALADDSLLYLSLQAEVRFPPERQQIIERKMSRDAGQPVTRA